MVEILRVDHAGELAAVQIYRGQRAVLGAARGHGRITGQLAEMEAQEAEHLARFDTLLTERRVRPTVMAPIWRLAGFALGAGTALMGDKAAHACTEAVENVSSAASSGSRSATRSWPTATWRLRKARHRPRATPCWAP